MLGWVGEVGNCFDIAFSGPYDPGKTLMLSPFIAAVCQSRSIQDAKLSDLGVEFLIAQQA